MVDRQGVLLATFPPSEAAEPNWRFARTADLVEVAVIIRALFNSVMNGDTRPSLYRSVRLLLPWVTDTAQIMHESYGNRELWQRLLDAYHFPSAVAAEPVRRATNVTADHGEDEPVSAEDLARELMELRWRIEDISGSVPQG